MTVEALISESSLEILPNGTQVGSCDGEKTGDAPGGIFAKVKPSYLICSDCPFSESCSESQAD